MVGHSSEEQASNLGNGLESGEAIEIDLVGELLQFLPIGIGYRLAHSLIYKAFRKQGFNWWQSYILAKLAGGEAKQVTNILEAIDRGDLEFDGRCLKSRNGKTFMCLSEVISNDIRTKSG
jgi:hypothetical protein